MGSIRRHLTYGNVVASLALFIALGGASYAAITLPKNSVGTKQLKKNAVVSSKVKNGSLLKSDFKAGQLPQGAQGVQGPKGDQGTQGIQGPAGTVPGLASTNGTIKLSVGQSQTVWSYGPFTITGTCTDNGGGSFSLTLSAVSTEANSELYNMEGSNNPDVETVTGTSFTTDTNTNVDFAAPSGAALDVVIHLGVHGLGADCWATGFGIGQG
jgi:hypothetical protein